MTRAGLSLRYNMHIKGLSQLRKHLPQLHTPVGILRLYFVPVLTYFLVSAFFRAEDRTDPFWLLDGEVVFGTLGFALLSLFFRVRSAYQARYGPLAYSKAVARFGYPAVAILAAVVARIGSIPGPPLPQVWWYPVLRILGWYWIAVGILLFLRVLQVFGLDNLTMLYVYVPEESRLVDQKMYSILRHPAYGAAQRIALGLALLNGTWFALTLALFFNLGLWGWARLAEEKELLARFGPPYAEYRRRVPAFWPRPRDLGRFYKLLLRGN